MTKKQWVELVIDYLAGGACPPDLSGRYHPAVIAEYFGLVYSDIIYQVHANAVRYKDYSQFDPYVKAYKNVPVLYDTDRDEYYSQIPASIINLPENRGIRVISPMEDQSSKFTYTDNNSADVRKELEGQSVVDYISFYVEGNNTYYRKFDTIYTRLLFKLLVPFSSFNNSDEMGIPAAQSLQVFTAITGLLRQKPAEKQTNDNNNV